MFVAENYSEKFTNYLTTLLKEKHPTLCFKPLALEQFRTIQIQSPLVEDLRFQITCFSKSKEFFYNWDDDSKYVEIAIVRYIDPTPIKYSYYGFVEYLPGGIKKINNITDLYFEINKFLLSNYYQLYDMSRNYK